MNTKRSFQSAKDVMTKKVVLIEGMATAKEAVEIMRIEKVKSLIVKKRYPQDACGIVSVLDFIKGVIIADKTSEEVNVFEIMTKIHQIINHKLFCFIKTKTGHRPSQKS